MLKKEMQKLVGPNGWYATFMDDNYFLYKEGGYSFKSSEHSTSTLSGKHSNLKSLLTSSINHSKIKVFYDGNQVTVDNFHEFSLLL